MPEDQARDPELPSGYWAAFGYQNHVVPTETPRRKDRRLAGLCGVLTRPEQMFSKDERPDCSWCIEQVRTGQIQIVCKPDTA